MAYLPEGKVPISVAFLRWRPVAYPRSGEGNPGRARRGNKAPSPKRFGDAALASFAFGVSGTMTIDVDEVVLFIHIVGAAVWLGGTVSLGIVAAAVHSVLGKDRTTYTRVMGRIGRSLGWTMWVALILTILTGLYNLTWYLPDPTWAAIMALPWLLAKLALVTLLVLLSAVHSFVLGPAIRHRAERGSAGALLGELRSLDRAISIASLGVTLLVVFAAVMVAS